MVTRLGEMRYAQEIGNAITFSTSEFHGRLKLFPKETVGEDEKMKKMKE